MAKKRKRFGPVLTVRSTMTPASASAMKSDCTLTSAGPYGHCLQTPKNNAAKNRTPALLHCKQGRVGGNYSCEPKARMSKHVTRAHGWCAFVCRGSDRARRSYWPCQKGGPLMLSLTANGEVPVLWVDGGTVAVMPCSRSIKIQSTGRRSTPRGPPDAAHSRPCMPPANRGCLRLPDA